MCYGLDCVSPKFMFKSYPPVSQTVTVFEDGAFKR